MKMALAPSVLIMLATLTNLALADNSVKQCPTSNGYIETSVNATAKASFLHTVEHHWKFEFWRGAVCWGSPDDQYQADQQFGESSNECTGAINFTSNRDNQLNYTPMSLSWGANLTDGDTFTIHLTDQRVQAVYQENNGDCTSDRLGASLQYASMTYDTRAVINVPQDVWVVQVRGKAKVDASSSLTDLKPKIGRVVLKDPKNPTAHLQSLSEREWTYLYVEPGEPLELTLSYSNQGLTGKKTYDVNYDFKFIGHNRCVEVLGDPQAVNYTPDYLNKMILAGFNSEADFHNYAVKLGCMRNPVFLQAAMNNSRPDDLLPMMTSLNQRTEQALTDTHNTNNELYAGPFLATILDMTLVDVSRFALADLMNYCKTYRNFTRETAVNNGVTEVAGVEFMMMTYSHLDMIYNQLARQSLSALVSRVQEWNKENTTYAQLFDGNKDAQLALRAYQHEMVQSGLEIYSTLYKEILDRVPKVEIAKSHLDQLLADLKAADTVASYTNVAIRQMLRDFGRRSNNVIDVSQLAGNVQQLSTLDAKIHGELTDYFKWFMSTANNGDNGDRFVSTLVTIENQVLMPSANNLLAISKDQNLKSLDEKFVRRDDLNKLNQDLTNCVFHPYGGGK